MTAVTLARPAPRGGISGAVAELALQGLAEPEIARRLGLPTDLVRQVFDHLTRTGALAPAGVGAGCSAVACAGCFFASGCSSRS